MRYFVQHASQSQAHVDLLDTVAPWNQKYCRRHGFEYVADKTPTQYAPFNCLSEGQVWFFGTFVQQHIGDEAAFLDSDALPVKPEISVFDCRGDADLAILGDQYGVNSGVIVMQITEALAALVKAGLQKGPVAPNQRTFDARLSAELRAQTEVKYKFFDDRWNWHNEYGFSKREQVTMPESEAVIRAWHGHEKRYAIKQIKQRIEALSNEY